MRSTLVTALVSCADVPFRSRARRFLSGLSCDELQFIADFHGACILESVRRSPCSRAQLADRIAEFQLARSGGMGCSADQEHKMIVLLEFLCRATLRQFAIGVRAEQAS